jgi:hypothetical protein
MGSSAIDEWMNESLNQSTDVHTLTQTSESSKHTYKYILQDIGTMSVGLVLPTNDW